MSHEITLRNGHEHAAYGRGKDAWHGHGITLDGLMTAAQVAEFVKFPEIGTTPTFIRKTVTLDDGTEIESFEEATGHYLTTATWHDGEVTPLGAVSERWKPIQAAAAFEIFDPITSEMGAIYDAAGVLKGGKVFWVLARVPGRFEITRDGVSDTSDRFLLFETANDGTGSATVRVTYIRVVCDNTLNVALHAGGAKPIKIRHTGDVDAKIAQTRGVVAAAWETMNRTEAEFTLMARTPLTREQRSKFVTDALGIDLDKPLTGRSKNILREVSEILAIGRGTSEFPEQRGTMWGALNAITEYVDHSRTVRNVDGADDRLASVGFGSGDKLKTRAFESAVTMMADGSLVTEEVEVALAEDNGESFADLLIRTDAARN